MRGVDAGSRHAGAQRINAGGHLDGARRPEMRSNPDQDAAMHIKVHCVAQNCHDSSVY
jgi:hypothetical protein